MHELLKEKMGIDVANCETCLHLGSDGDGNYPEIEITWPTCNKIERMGNLKSFPFKKEMKCWEPDFWMSKFSEMIKTGTAKEVEKAGDAFYLALNEVHEKLAGMLEE